MFFFSESLVDKFHYICCVLTVKLLDIKTLTAWLVHYIPVYIDCFPPCIITVEKAESTKDATSEHKVDTKSEPGTAKTPDNKEEPAEDEENKPTTDET